MPVVKSRTPIPVKHKRPFMNLDPDAQGRIDFILKGIRSINRITSEIWLQLLNVPAGKFWIEKFEVQPDQYHEWRHQGVRSDRRRYSEYDRRTKRFIVVPRISKLYDCLYSPQWKVPIQAELQKLIGGTFERRDESFSLREDEWEYTARYYEGIKNSQHEYPLVVFEACINEHPDTLVFDAHRWLQGTGGAVKAVIVVDVQETQTKKGEASIGVKSCWGLTPAQFLSMEMADSYAHVIEWHANRGIPFSGEFKVYAHLWRASNEWAEPEMILGASVSMDENDQVGNYINTLHRPIIRTGELIPSLSPVLDTPFEIPIDDILPPIREGIKDTYFDRILEIVQWKKWELTKKTVPIKKAR